LLKKKRGRVELAVKKKEGGHPRHRHEKKKKSASNAAANGKTFAHIEVWNMLRSRRKCGETTVKKTEKKKKKQTYLKKIRKQKERGKRLFT